ncbi:MAG: flavin reductase [Clostridia bacterium]|nr:flavin reductase [Clostridia bacterium]
MAKQIWKGGTLLAPMPAVLITCKGTDRNGMEAENVFTVAWTGILNTVPPKTYISVRKGRYSYDIIKNSGEFVINIPTAAMVKAVDYCGMFTGAKVNKFEKCELLTETASEVNAPVIVGCPLSLECRVTDVVEMGTHDMFIADILCTGVEESIIDSEGKLRLDKAGLMAFAHGEYYALGKRIGNFGFSAEKKNSKKKAEAKKEAKKEARKASADTVKIKKEIPLAEIELDTADKGMGELILDDIIKDIEKDMETDIPEEAIPEKPTEAKKGYPRKSTNDTREKKDYKSDRKSYSDKPYRKSDKQPYEKKAYEKKPYGKKDSYSDKKSDRKPYGKDSDFKKDYKKDFKKDGFKKDSGRDFKKDGFKKDYKSDYKKDSKKPYKKEYKK